MELCINVSCCSNEEHKGITETLYIKHRMKYKRVYEHLKIKCFGTFSMYTEKLKISSTINHIELVNLINTKHRPID